MLAGENNPQDFLAMAKDRQAALSGGVPIGELSRAPAWMGGHTTLSGSGQLVKSQGGKFSGTPGGLTTIRSLRDLGAAELANRMMEKQRQSNFIAQHGAGLAPHADPMSKMFARAAHEAGVAPQGAGMLANGMMPPPRGPGGTAGGGLSKLQEVMRVARQFGPDALKWGQLEADQQGEAAKLALTASEGAANRAHQTQLANTPKALNAIEVAAKQADIDLAAAQRTHQEIMTKLESEPGSTLNKRRAAESNQKLTTLKAQADEARARAAEANAAAAQVGAKTDAVGGMTPVEKKLAQGVPLEIIREQELKENLSKGVLDQNTGRYLDALIKKSNPMGDPVADFAVRNQPWLTIPDRLKRRGGAVREAYKAVIRREHPGFSNADLERWFENHMAGRYNG
jgi:hypothetical protein